MTDGFVIPVPINSFTAWLLFIFATLVCILFFIFYFKELILNGGIKNLIGVIIPISVILFYYWLTKDYLK